jgi:DNA-binding CsgD family transcriptional regulator
MATITTAAALLLALILLPLLVLAWASESRQQRARRWRRNGMTQQAIANRLGCSRTTVRRLLAA